MGALTVPAQADLVAHWDFNEGSGTTVADSVASIGGELQGNATWVPGLDGYAIQIEEDETSQVYVGTPEALDLTGAVTVMAWVHPDGKSDYGVIAGIDQSGGAGTDQYVLKTTNSPGSYLTFQVTNTSEVGVTATDTVSIDQRAAADTDGWLHVAAVFAPGEAVILYVNGTQVARTNTSVTTMQSTLSEAVPFRIGHMTTTSPYAFNGAIDEVSVYDNAVDATTIAQLAANTEPPTEGEYLFSFGAVADPQYKDAAAAGSRFYRNTLDKLPAMVTDFNGRDLEFVICLGDFIDNDFASYAVMMDIWDDLTAPTYQVVGNHDLSIGSHTLAEVIEVMNIPSNYYTFTYQGWRFLVFDGNDAGYGVHTDEQLAWARDALDQALADGEPVIIFDHYPIYPPGTPHISPQGADLLALIGDYPNVRAWMNGHNHAGAYGQTNGIHCLNMEGMVETADTTAYAEIEVWSNRFEVLGEGREPDRTLLFPAAPEVELDAPAGLVVADGGSGIALSWDAYTDADATSLVLQRRISGQNIGYETLATLTTADTGYLDANAASGVTYIYRLRAVTDTAESSDWSALASFELGFIPGQISELSATGGTDNEITLSWDLGNATYESLVLERSYGDSGVYTLVTDELAGDATSYTDTGLLPNSNYTYRISGVIAGRQTEWSEAGTAASGSVPALQGEAAGLVAYWSFDEGTGVVTGDYSGNGSNGTLAGAPVWSAGKFNGALSFSGDSEDQVLVGTPDLLNITGAVTVMAWVKPDGLSNYGVIAGIDESGGATNDQFVLKTTTSTDFKLSFQVSAGGSGYTATDTVSLSSRSSQTDDGWVHVAGVFTPGESVALYVNGELVASKALSIETLQSTLSEERPFRIGNMSQSYSYGFNGSIDEVRVFADSVSAEDIATYAAGEAITHPVGTLIEKGSDWAYLDDGSDPGSAWRAVDFDDSSWSTGAAPLGYGDGDEATVISYGSDSGNKHPAYYFRQSFELDEAGLATIAKLKFAIQHDDGVVVYINGTEVIRANMPEGEVTYQTYAADDVDDENAYYAFTVDPDALVAGTNVIAVEIHNRNATSSDISFDLGLEPVLFSADTLIYQGSDWAYLDNGSDQGTAWQAVDFDDSSWSTGPAPLGYGDGDEATVISYGPDGNNKYPTAYFRQSFELDELNLSLISALKFSIQRDDGIVVYVNGTEVLRDVMPTGAIDYLTYATDAVDGGNEDTYFEYTVPADALVAGTNVIAVEVHQQRASSSDVSFDLGLETVLDISTLIEAGADWAYLDNGSDQGTAWQAVDFDDSSWSTGPAPLGYGDGDEATVLSYGPDGNNKYPTAYFRRSFDLNQTGLDLIEQLKFAIQRDDGIVVYINGTEVVRDVMPTGTIDYLTYATDAVDGSNEDTYFEYTVPADALAVGTNVIAVEVHQQRASSSDISFDLNLEALTASDLALQDQLVIDSGHSWKYLDNGSDQGTAWSALDFDDSTWASGPSKFGYGDGNETTTLTDGPGNGDKFITYYFRTSFDVVNAAEVAGLVFEVVRDDGVIVYLNGHEVVRDNMPAGAIDYMTFSASITSGSDEDTFFEFPVAADYLVDGTNVIAVEVHNRDANSSDLGFDLKLSLQAVPDPNAPVFSEDTIVADNAYLTGDYDFSLADYVTDADGDDVVFSKVSGPDWLTVNPDGTLSGTPGPGDVGANSFVIAVTDNDEGTTTAVIEITVEDAPELARAPLPGSDEALVFGVIPDTQGGTNGTPPDEAAAIAARFIEHDPAFIIHVGDVTDGNSSDGNTKFAQLEDLKELLVNPLADHGIGFYPVRGNHDSNAYNHTSAGVSAWAAAFPYLFEGPDAVIDPEDVPGGSPGSPNDSNFCYVFDAGHNTFFVSVDQWNGGASSNYSNWVAEKFAEIRSEHPDAHIFGYSHSGLYAMASHPAMSEFVNGGADPYIAAGRQYEIDGWFSGHNHIYDRSMAINLNDDNKPYMFDFTCGSASEKFYSLSRVPAEDQHLNIVIDSNAIPGRPICYLMAEVNGPFVSVTTYMSPDTSGSGTFDDWSVWDAYTYSRNGLQFTIAAGQNYNERNVTDTAPEEGGFVGTTVSLIDGVNSDTTTYTVGSTTFSPYRNITTGWFTQDQWYDDGGRQLVSDIVSIHGMRNVPDRNRSDAYTLVMSYDPETLSALQQESLSLVAFLDEDTSDSDPGEWIDAVEATLATPAEEPLMRAPTSEDAVGSWGIDAESGVIWARLDYQGDFAVASNVPDTDGDGLADAWEMTHFGNLTHGANEDADGDGLTNLEEQAAGSSPLLKDSDGDLFDDAVEVAYGMDPASADMGLSDSVIDFIRNHPDVQPSYGLYTQDRLGTLAGRPLMKVDESGNINLELQLWESPDLENWSKVGTPEQRSISVPANAQLFYQWEMAPPQD